MITQSQAGIEQVKKHYRDRLKRRHKGKMEEQALTAATMNSFHFKPSCFVVERLQPLDVKESHKSFPTARSCQPRPERSRSSLSYVSRQIPASNADIMREAGSGIEKGP